MCIPNDKIALLSILQQMYQYVYNIICDMAYIVPMHVKPKFTYLLTYNIISKSVYVCIHEYV